MMPESTAGGAVQLIRTREVDNACVIELGGEVDLSWSPKIRAAILDGIARGRAVFVELAGVSYIDSSGIASFVEGYQRARQARLQFGLIAASNAVMSVLKLARLDSVFPLYSDLRAAQAAGT